MVQNLPQIFSNAHNPVLRDALHLVFETMPHKRGQCLLALPLSTSPLFDQWVADRHIEFERNLLEGRESAYQGIASPHKETGFFCAIFIDRQDVIENFLKDMNLFGTEDYLIIRKEKRPRAPAQTPPPRVSDGR